MHLAVISTDTLLSDLLIDTIGTVVIFVALVRIATTPAAKWAHGWLSKTAWIVATIWFAPTHNGVLVPVAAIAAIWHTRQLNKVPAGEPSPLPYAQGSPEGSHGKEQS